ncbi:MAG: hypothetical protein KY455_03730 [Euryarchaeota archaeon]|nr:hypothetical protein [Euryarchaeota archaeon]
MRPSVLIAVSLLSLTLAGCLGGDTTTPADEPQANFLPELSSERVAAADKDLSKVIDSDHGGVPYLHAVPHLHEGSYGMRLVGYDPLTREGDEAPPNADSGYAAIDTWKHLVCIAHFAGSGGAGGGATIIDIADPTKPKVLASIPSMAVNSDCQFTDDGRYLLLATYTGAHAGPSLIPLLPPHIADAGANGVSVYDVQNPADPKFLFHDVQGADAPRSGAYHNVFTAQINGTHYVFQTYTGNILKIKEDASGLEMVSKIDHSDHDLWVGRHAITGEWTVVTGAGNGTAIFNVDDPAKPELLGVWEGDPDNRTKGWHRQWAVDGTIDGRAYLVVAGEECGNGDSLPYTVLDWTDPTTPFKTGSWWIPGEPANPRTAYPHLCEMNSHEFEVWNGYVATGNYHAGVWLFDVGSTERTQEPATIGYYLPSEDPRDHGGQWNVPFYWSPDVWGAYFDERGYIIAADWWSGLYILEFEGTAGIVE